MGYESLLAYVVEYGSRHWQLLKYTAQVASVYTYRTDRLLSLVVLHRCLGCALIPNPLPPGKSIPVGTPKPNCAYSLRIRLQCINYLN